MLFAIEGTIGPTQTLPAGLGPAGRHRIDFMRFSSLSKAVLSLAIVTGGFVASHAQADESYTIEEVQACSGDAMRLCRDALPDISKIETCMESKKSQLSKACLAMFAPGRKR